MDDSDYQKLRETGWRRPLTPAEEEQLRKFLTARPAFQGQWDEDAALNRLLQRMPPARVSSNFTARVMQAASAVPARPAWSGRAPFQWLPRNWMPRVALGLAMLACGFFSFHEYQSVYRAQRARQMAAMPPIEWMKDFETINRLNKVSVADDDLLAVLH